jgi:hypothetical protein
MEYSGIYDLFSAIPRKKNSCRGGEAIHETLTFRFTRTDGSLPAWTE